MFIMYMESFYGQPHKIKVASCWCFPFLAAPKHLYIHSVYYYNSGDKEPGLACFTNRIMMSEDWMLVVADDDTGKRIALSLLIPEIRAWNAPVVY